MLLIKIANYSQSLRFGFHPNTMEVNAISFGALTAWKRIIQQDPILSVLSETILLHHCCPPPLSEYYLLYKKWFVESYETGVGRNLSLE